MLPHETALAGMEFVPGIMHNVDDAFRQLRVTIGALNTFGLQADIGYLQEDLWPGEADELTKAVNKSLARVIFDNITEEQKRELLDLLESAK